MGEARPLRGSAPVRSTPPRRRAAGRRPLFAREFVRVGFAAAMAPHVHTQTFRVVMAEVDLSQIHFTAIYRWMDRGWSEWLAEVGHPFSLIMEEGPGVPIVDSRCSFLARILIDDEITLRTRVGGIGRTSFRSRHEFTRAGVTVARGELVHVCVNRATREPVPVPGWLRERAGDLEDVPPAGT